MENLRMQVLKNLDLAIDIVLDQGIVVLKKYDDLDFYLSQIANGRIYDLKAREQIKKMQKTRKILQEEDSDMLGVLGTRNTKGGNLADEEVKQPENKR